MQNRQRWRNVICQKSMDCCQYMRARNYTEFKKWRKKLQVGEIQAQESRLDILIKLFQSLIMIYWKSFTLFLMIINAMLGKHHSWCFMKKIEVVKFHCCLSLIKLRFQRSLRHNWFTINYRCDFRPFNFPFASFSSHLPERKLLKVKLLLR